MSLTLRYALLAFALCDVSAALAQSFAGEPIRPLPERVAGDPARIALGRQLFHDLRFSRDNRQSCASCHDFARGGADGKAHSTGHGGKSNVFNTPTVFNSALNFRQSWTGRDATLEERLDFIITSPAVFNNSWSLVVARLADDAFLASRFDAAYPNGLRAENVRDALAQYLRQLVTPSRFDRFLRGDQDAISAQEKQGYAKFKDYGCTACHQGINVGGNMFQKFGAMRELPNLTSAAADLGRFSVTGSESDRHVFRVPSLRNVALTAPYFHNGSVATLEEAVDVMFRYQLGRSASSEDKALIVRFLQTLNAEHPPAAGAGK